MGDGQPESKLTIAKRASYAIIHDLPADQQVTLVNYPGVFNFKPIEGCSTGEIRFGPGVADKAKLAAEVRSMFADGGTPIGPTLQGIGELFERTGAASGTVMLLSDGEANCGTTDVCTVARDLRSKGLALTVNTVAFDLNEEGTQQLKCIADATGGKALQVDHDGNLTEAMAIASGPKLDVSVHAPSALEAVTGQRDLGAANRIEVVVASTGSVPASDVRVSLTISDGKGQPGAAYVPRPVRNLGTLGRSVPTATAVFQPRPLAGTASPLTWQATVTTSDAKPIVVEGSVPLTDSAKFATAGPLLTESKHVVVLGDSYSSGEGGAQYDADDRRGTGEYQCHRSANAYARQLFSGAGDSALGPSSVTLTMLACSGAVTSDLIRYQHIWDIKPQLTRLKELSDDANPPDLVLMTLGGNDAKFPEFVVACMGTGVAVDWRSLTTWFPCQADPNSFQTPDVEHYLVTKTLIANLSARYRDLDAVLNAPDVVARRGGRVAQIVVLPYVNPLPPQERLRGGCFLWVAPYEAQMAEDLIRKLNGAVTTAVATTRAEGLPIRLVDPIMDTFQDGHTICDEATAVRVDSVLWKKALELNPFDEQRYTSELMHPSQLGYRLEAQTLIEWSRSQAANWTIPHTPQQVGLTLETPYQVTFRRPVSPYVLPVDVGPRMPEPGDPALFNCSGLFAADQCETITKAKLRMVHIETDPRYLGSAWAADGPDALGQITLPVDLPEGDHTLVIYAFGDGKVDRLASPIHVYPPGTRTSVRLVVLGLILTSAGLIVGFVSRRRRG